MLAGSGGEIAREGEKGEIAVASQKPLHGWSIADSRECGQRRVGRIGRERSLDDEVVALTAARENKGILI